MVTLVAYRSASISVSVASYVEFKTWRHVWNPSQKNQSLFSGVHPEPSGRSDDKIKIDKVERALHVGQQLLFVICENLVNCNFPRDCDGSHSGLRW